jgi:hypothetical protein
MDFITPQDLAGTTKVFDIRNRVTVPGLGQQDYDFGALVKLKETKKVGDKEFTYGGWLGQTGDTVNFVAEYNENPAKSQNNPDQEQPSLRIFAQVGGQLLEIVVGFRQVPEDPSKKVYHSGFSTGHPKKNLTFWPYTPKPKTDQPQ